MPSFTARRSISKLITGNARRFVVAEEGAALVEYGLLLMLIALICIVALQGIGKKVSKSYEAANTLLP